MTTISAITGVTPKFAASAPRFSSNVHLAAPQQQEPPKQRSFLKGLLEGYFTERFIERGIKNLQKDEHGRRHPLKALFWFGLAFIFGRKAFADLLGRKLGNA